MAGAQFHQGKITFTKSEKDIPGYLSPVSLTAFNLEQVPQLHP